MAGLATDALVYVNTVIEVDKIRKIVHASPLDRLAGPVAFANGFERRARRPHLRMAIHAYFCCRHIGKGRVFNCGVAVTAINSQAADVMFVTEGNGLLAGNILHGFVWRSHN